MPTIVQRGGFMVRVLLPPREHGPPHVHVAKADGEVLINLSPIGVREVLGMRPADVVRAVRVVDEHHGECLMAWRRYHG